MQAKPSEYIVHLEVRLSGPEIDWDKLADQLSRDVEEMVVYVGPPPVSGPFVTEAVRVDSAEED